MKSRTVYDYDNDNLRLVSFLYTLMRDDMPTGRVHELYLDAVQESTPDGTKIDSISFTNSYLADYALEIARGLTRSDS